MNPDVRFVLIVFYSWKKKKKRKRKNQNTMFRPNRPVKNQEYSLVGHLSPLSSNYSNIFEFWCKIHFIRAKKPTDTKFHLNRTVNNRYINFPPFWIFAGRHFKTVTRSYLWFTPKIFLFLVLLNEVSHDGGSHLRFERWPPAL